MSIKLPPSYESGNTQNQPSLSINCLLYRRKRDLACTYQQFWRCWDSVYCKDDRVYPRLQTLPHYVDRAVSGFLIYFFNKEIVSSKS